jgi:hypothetical protein
MDGCLHDELGSPSGWKPKVWNPQDFAHQVVARIWRESEQRQKQDAQQGLENPLGSRYL